MTNPESNCLNRVLGKRSVVILVLVRRMGRSVLGFFILGLVAVAQSAFASVDLIYDGVAKDTQGKVLYIEKHKAEFSAEGKIVRATTHYVRENGELIGVMQSDFTKAVTAPDYLFRDLRDGSEHGIRLIGKELILFRRDKNGTEEEKTFRQSDFDDGVLLVGCQGLHYYLIDHLEEIKGKEKIPIKLLIPGKLDYYSFTMYYEDENDGIIKLKIMVSNLFLRLFVPALDVLYRKSDRKLLTYFGVSNLLDDEGDLQKVSIEYDY